MRLADTSATSEADLARELGATLTRLYAFLRSAILPQGMTLTQASALATLRREGPQRVTDLAAREGVRQPTCTGLVNVMEEQGWVRRRDDASDRRAVMVELTEAGHQALEDITAARVSVLEQRLGALDEGERAALALALPSLLRLIESRGSGA
ncbi:MarR family winged helix-turn-helix transcriptional regulator [Conexibacter sp. S30A1]|uniref:MarR family winged helix-turn-helix transcriptional regulator n=1 Tax=Conexibacter sp. S30A1 TaxID=2937800 RepID=UPI00200EE82D|nr:MarR family transcriptional regulator [Conexibacter sp. S30A1]